MSTSRRIWNLGWKALFSLAAVLVLMLGACSSGESDSAPRQNSWQSCSEAKEADAQCPGPLVNARFGHTATLLDGPECKTGGPDHCGKVLVVGGTQAGCISSGQLCDPLGSAEIYNPEEGTWQLAANLKEPRSDHTATLLPNGTVLVVGGFKKTKEIEGEATSATLSSAEIFDPGKGTWRKLNTPKLLGRVYHTATVLSEGSVSIRGGTTVGALPNTDYRYNPLDESWENIPPLRTARSNHQALVLKDSILVTGGLNASAVPLASAELVRPSTKSSEPAGVMAISRYSHTSTILPNGYVLVVGGIDRPPGSEGGQGRLNLLASAEVLDPQAKIWRPTLGFPRARAAHTATLMESGRVLLAGGGPPFATATGSRRTKSLKASELFDSETGNWRGAEPMTTARALHTATLLDGPSCEEKPAPLYCGKVLIAGGRTNGTTDPDVGPYSATNSTELFSETGFTEIKEPGAFAGPFAIVAFALLLAGVSWAIVGRESDT